MTRTCYSTTTHARANVERTISRTGSTVRLEVRRAGGMLASHVLRGEDLDHMAVACAIATCGRPAFVRVATLPRPRGAHLEIIADSTPRVLVGRYEHGVLVHGFGAEAEELDALARALADAREAT